MKLLIIEDDPMVRSINAGFVRKIDPKIEILEAGTLEKGKSLLLEEEIALVLLDVYLGRESGPTLLKWLREAELAVDVILITADNSSETVESAFRLGALDYLIKPFTFERFKEALCKAISRQAHLNRQTEVDQKSIDAMLRREPETASEVPSGKGINVQTHELIVHALKESNTPLTAQDIAGQTGLARVTVRRYLTAMADQGLLEETLHYGKIGRPQKYYVLKQV